MKNYNQNKCRGLIVRLTALLAVFALMLPFVGCGNDEITEDTDPIVMTYKDKTVTASEFEFYLSIYKARFAQVYSDFSDTAEFYNSMIGDVTAEEYLFDMVVQNVTRSLVSEVLFYEKGLEMTDAIVSDIEYYIDSLIYENFSDDDETFNKELAKYGITALQLRNIYLRDEMTYSLFTLLADDRDTIGATDSEMQEYLEENYVRIQHIYVNNKYTYLTDSDGNLVYDGNGQIMTVAMSGKELSTKNALVDSIDEALGEGGDFLEVYSAFSEDKLYENGYYLTEDIDFVDEVVDAAFALEVGEWVKVESAVGTHYVMRMEMDEKPWENSVNSDFLGTFSDTVINEKFGEYLDSFADEVVINEEALDGFSVRTSKANYIF